MKNEMEDIGRIKDTYWFVEKFPEEVYYMGVNEPRLELASEDTAKQDYILTSGRYVGIEEQEDDGEPFEDKMKRLTSELSEMFAKSNERQKEIREKLGAIGYEI